MATLLALYKTPANPSAFDAHYTSTHAPLAKTLPGLKSYRLSKGPVNVGAGESPYYLVAILEFESLTAIQTALGSPEGQATAGDLANFAQAGVELLTFDTQDA
jgi:uncharacterized protein (TIGR02118 family)